MGGCADVGAVRHGRLTPQAIARPISCAFSAWSKAAAAFAADVLNPGGTFRCQGCFRAAWTLALMTQLKRDFATV